MAHGCAVEPVVEVSSVHMPLWYATHSKPTLRAVEDCLVYNGAVGGEFFVGEAALIDDVHLLSV